MLKTGTWLFVTIVWFVFLLKGSKAVDLCPVCNGRSQEVIPVEDYENYKLEVTQKKGLSVEFDGRD